MTATDSTEEQTARRNTMNFKAKHDSWSSGQSYEQYMGRWSGLIAEKFVDWVDPPENLDWLELGCGTGALTNAILSHAAPGSILATDQADDFVTYAKSRNEDKRAQFAVADALHLPYPDGSRDIVTSALVFNFLPDPQKAFAEMRRVLRPGGFIAFYVWDYPGGGMGFVDTFWKTAAEIDARAAELDEGLRFPFCQKDGLDQLCQEAGIKGAEIEALEVETRFPDFEALWHPFTLGVGPPPGYVDTLSQELRSDLKARLSANLGSDGPISLTARAWAVKAKLPAAG
ncbi:class I SAM-dependent methyltransferase [Primorskyibacter sp. 2E233]|uniref:class I SAM-dependent methyltransferase n=1 Tax=Primorskyibacter sp. 2E233 TaxID=3413431 RepID=UPI003BF383C6